MIGAVNIVLAELAAELTEPFPEPRAPDSLGRCAWDALVACTQERRLTAMRAARCDAKVGVRAVEARPRPGDVMGRFENENGRFKAVATAGGVAVVPDEGEVTS